MSYPESRVEVSVGHRSPLLHILGLNSNKKEEEEEGVEEECQGWPLLDVPTNHSAIGFALEAERMFPCISLFAIRILPFTRFILIL